MPTVKLLLILAEKIINHIISLIFLTRHCDDRYENVDRVIGDPRDPEHPTEVRHLGDLRIAEVKS